MAVGMLTISGASTAQPTLGKRILAIVPGSDIAICRFIMPISKTISVASLRLCSKYPIRLWSTLVSQRGIDYSGHVDGYDSEKIPSLS